MNLKKVLVTVLFFFFLFFMLTSLTPLSAQGSCGNCGDAVGAIQKCDGRAAQVEGNTSGNCIAVQGYVIQDGEVFLNCTYTQFYNCPQTGAQADGCPLDQGAIFSGCGGTR